VYGHDLVGVVLQEGLPSLRWGLPSCCVLRNGGLADFDAQFQQLSMDSRDTPGGELLATICWMTSRS
jgi:hypothetical protein